MRAKSKLRRRPVVTKKKKAAPTRVAVKRPRTISPRTDLGAVAGRYIGETEKNLNKVLATTPRAGAVLLFDEADALMGKRTEVKDAHDRYANVEIATVRRKVVRKKTD